MSNLKLSLIISAVDRLTQPVRKITQSTDRLGESVRKQREEMGRLARTRGDIEHFRKLRQSTAQTSQALSEARDRAAQLGRRLSRTTNPTAKMRREFDQARRSVRALQSQHQSQQQQLQQLRTRLRQAGVSTRNLGDAQRRLRAQSEQATRSLEQQQQRLQRMQNARKALAAGMMKTAGLVAAGFAGIQVGQGAMGLLSSPVQTAANFEEAMSGVGAVARATEEQLAALTANAKELGATTRYSAAESAAGMKYLAMAGFSTKQIMTSLPGVMNMATAGAADLGRASDISSDILSAFGLRAREMNRVADTLTATFTRSNTSLEMLGETMKYVGPVARTAGMSLEETSAMAGLLGDVGIKSSQAGTTLRAMLQRLANPTGAAADTLHALGVEVTDLEGNIRSVPQILGELAEATANMGSGERLAALFTLFDAEAAAGVSELIAQQGAQGVTKFTEILKGAGGEAARVARQMDDNANGGFRAMNSAIEGLKISFGDLLLPAVRSATTVITGLTRRLTAFTNEWPTLSKWLGYGVAAIAGLAFAFGGLMSVLAGVLGSMVAVKFAVSALGLKGLFASGAFKALGASMMTMVKGAIPAAIAGIRMLGVAVMANPIGAIIGGIALAAGLIIANWGNIGPWFSGLWDRISGRFGKGWEMIKTVFSFSPLGLIMKAWQPMLNWVAEKAGWIGDLVGRVTGWFGGDGDNKGNGGASKTARQVGVASAVSAAVAATPVAAQPATAPIAQQNAYTISIQQQPGENSNELAERVMQRIREREAISRQSAQYDEF